MKLIGEGGALLAFYAAKTSVESVHKTETADMGKYQVRYASLNAVHAECERACELHKLVLVQEPTTRDGLFAVLNTLIHEDGSMLELEPMCLPLPKEAQALGSATTYLRRYSLVAQFGLAVEDDDGQAATIAAQAQPGRRTEAERIIHEQIALMEPDLRRQFMADFQEHFRSTLSDLPANKHGEALTWAKEWSPPVAEQSAEDAADAAFVAEAAGESFVSVEMAVGSYSTLEAAERARVSYRQIDYWLRTGAVKIADGSTPGTGNYRRFTPAEVEALCTVADLYRAAQVVLREFSEGRLWQITRMEQEMTT